MVDSSVADAYRTRDRVARGIRLSIQSRTSSRPWKMRLSMTDSKETKSKGTDENDAAMAATATGEAAEPPAGAAPRRKAQAAAGSGEETSAAPAKRKKSPASRAASKPDASPPYAVVETGGKQYRVTVGESLSVEKLAVDSGSDVTLDRVLLVSSDGSTRVGTPTVDGVTVSARVDDHFRGEKIVVFKYKPKKGYRRRTGHRQSLTRLTITGISG